MNDAFAQLDWGTDLDKMEQAAQALRDIDPAHGLLPALELRMRQSVRIRLMLAKANLMAHREANG